MSAKGRTAFTGKARRIRPAPLPAACFARLPAVRRVLRQIVLFALPAAFCLGYALPAPCAAGGFVVRIYERQSGKLHAEAPAGVNSRLFFGWTHSQERIPWNEYYHVDGQGRLVLDAVTFPAFGAGIPENAGRVCYVRDGLIHMEEIDRPFDELDWLNSHTATRDIRIDGRLVARGSDLPRHTRMRLVIEEKEAGRSAGME
ncbi:MAG: DUF1850 domain-containing protein [Desulfovibrio sp.]|jgi:hypothetical protein|nr:DUF1850 domain-containing protein [Desulfovibrio sp.]